MEQTSAFVAGLNPAQRAAVETIAGPLLILAGPGSGKTRVITHRIAYLMREVGVSPFNILAVTFTNKAARSMGERLEELVREDARRLTIGTFHAVCSRILRREGPQIGIGSNFTIYDDDDQIAAVRSVLKDLNLDEKQFSARAILSRISNAKAELKSPHHFGEYTESYWEEIVLRVYKRYQEILFQNNALDFDDLLMQTIRLFREQPDTLRKYQERYVHVLVDEFQDTNVAQYTIVKQLSALHRNLCVVGDEDQCLVRGTRIAMADGTQRPIERVRPGDLVLSGYGSGDFRAARVVRIAERHRPGEGIAITTAAGRRLVSTPEHVHFAGYVYGLTPQTYFTYLMRRRGVGYRLGTTQVYTNGQIRPVLGFAQRLTQERGDALWIVATHRSENDARAEEYILSLRYGIPTLPFVPRRGGSTNGLVHDSSYLARVYGALDTDAAAQRLLDDRGLSIEHPHCRPRSRNSSRRNVVLTLCGDRRGAHPMHRLSLVGNDGPGQSALKELRLSVRAAKAGSESWRHETARRSYADLLQTVDLLGTRLDLNVVRQARLGRGGGWRESNSLPFTPAASVMPGMALFDEGGGYDFVESVERVPLDGPVYDLDIEHTHNFVANGIVTHNSVYSWRGANFRNVLDFESDFPDARVVYLEQNYRSTQTILSAARRVISANTMRKEKELWTENEVGLPIRVFEAYNEEEEASFVANEIERLTHQGLYQPRDFAVLYRTNVQSRALEKVFVRRRIPHKVVGVRFYERREVKDILAYLKVLHNPDDSQGMARILNVPPRGIGQKTVAELDRFAHRVGASWHGALKTLRDEAVPSPFNARTNRLLLEFLELVEALLAAKAKLDVVALIELVLQRSGYADWVRDGTEEGDERWQNVQELGTVALQYADYEPPAGLAAFLEETALVADVDGFDETANAVSLITFHAAKGLEFPVVFMTGLEEGISPHSRSFDDPNQMEEERRLAYVAITRARERLYMVYAFRRNLFGGSMTNVPSRFIADVPSDLKRGHDLRAHSGAALQRHAVEPAGPAPTRTAFVERDRPRALDASFVPGDRVRHAKFGEGIVVSSVVVGGDEEVTVAFPKIGVKKLSMSFAPLERL